MVPQADDRDHVKGAVGGAVAATAEPVAASGPAAARGLRRYPTELAKAPSLRIRSGLSPAVTRN
jgi:hypothetical protein